MTRFYATTPIYYVNDEPHIGHAYTTIVGDALDPLAPPARRAGQVPHRHRRARPQDPAGGRRRRAVPAGVRRRHRPAVRRRLGVAGDRQRRLHPHHRAAPPHRRRSSCCSAATTPATSSSTTTAASTACAARPTTPTTSCSPGDLCPIHKLPVDEFEEENYFFRLSRYGDRLLDWYAAHPGAIVPEFRGNEALGLIRSGLRDFSISRTSVDWGIPLPWDSKHVAYVWFDALTNYLTAVGFGTRRRGVRRRGGRPTCHLIGKDIIRFHCVYWPAMLLSAGIEPPQRLRRRRLAARRQREDVARRPATSSSRSTSSTRSASTACATTCSPTRRTATTATSRCDGLIARYNADLANNLGNLTSRIATVVGSKCGGIGPAPVAGQPARPTPRRRPSPERAPAWDAVAPHRALEATWSLIRATNAYLEANEPWKAEPGPDVDAVLGDAIEALRIVAVLASPAMPATAPADLGAPRPARVGRRPAPPERRAVGRLPGWAARSPRASRCSRASSDRDGAGRLVRQPLPPRRRRTGGPSTTIDEARAAGVTTMIVVGCDRATSLAPHRSRRRPRRRVSHRRPASPRGPPRRRHDRRPARRADTVAIGECGLDYHYDHSPRDVQREAFAAQIALANERGLPLVIHTREAWDDTFDVLGGVGVPARVVFHCFTGGPDEARRCARPRRVAQLLGDRHVQERRRCPRRRGAVPRGAPADRDRQPVPGAGPASRPAQPARRAAPSSERISPSSAGSRWRHLFDASRHGARALAFLLDELRSRALGTANARAHGQEPEQF